MSRITEATFLGLTIKGTPKQVEEMLFLMDYERFHDPLMMKYFHVFVREGSGRYYFPREKYFVSDEGETNYAVAFLRQQGIEVYC